ncbi:hypothetical protein [Antribacter gilvus]|uniref:hypothetical protein n=1 Tax=Antribacter gilvus TaxID=2304675 RepID=UPI000F7B0473|nr:hypothetical protein [Antribacter gilvus]
MVKIVEFVAPDSIRLGDLSPQEAEKAAIQTAEEMISRLGGLRPVGINAMALSRIETEVWVQWTRACCGHRALIEDFEEPIVSELDVAASRLPARLQGVHLESTLRTVRLQGTDHVAE